MIKAINDYNYFIVQDGYFIPNDIKEKFKKNLSIKDLRIKDSHYVINFVGLIINRKGEVIISFPKNFHDGRDLFDNLSFKEVRHQTNILFKTLIKEKIKSTDHRAGKNDSEIIGYPFKEFYEVYDYYLKHGLLTKNIDTNKFGYSGNIDWRKSIKHSPRIYVNKNLMFLPLVIKNSYEENDFLSKCIAYVINSTIESFPFLELGNRVNLHIDSMNINFNNKTKIIEKLHRRREKAFKDSENLLINSLINFFKNKDANEGALVIKTYTFHSIWENMVRNYLNNYSLNYDEKLERLTFPEAPFNSSYYFKKETFQVDERAEKIKRDGGNINIDSIKTFSIEPDYYYESEERVYILDAKYTDEINQLDYKQLSYNFLLRSMKALSAPPTMKFHSALIIPSFNEQIKVGNHFIFDGSYFSDQQDLIIKTYHINIFKLMKFYL